MVEYDKLKLRIVTHRRNIESGALKFDSDAAALGYLLALDDVLVAMDELRLYWSTSND